MTAESLEWNGAGGSPLAGEAANHSPLDLHRGFTSHYLPGARDIAVYTPPGYNPHSARRHPVLYLHDGQNLFDSLASSQPGISRQVREHADAAIEGGEAESLLIVSVYHAGERRLAEYTHQNDGRMGGEAEPYGLLLTRELMPWIAARYRVLPQREATGMGGSSLGGLITLYLGLHYAERFVDWPCFRPASGGQKKHSRLSRCLRASHSAQTTHLAGRGRKRERAHHRRYRGSVAPAPGQPLDAR
jgi:enterochelin esterase-like enzyme